MYKAKAIGTQRGIRTGRKYRFFPGQTVDAPNGDLYGLDCVQWIGDEPEKGQEVPEPRETTIIPDQIKSSDFTVREALEMAKEMSPEKLSEFIKGDNRKTVCKRRH